MTWRILIAALCLAQTQAADPVIDDARRAATAFAASLPNYIVKRTTTRFRGSRASRNAPAETVRNWRTLDTVSVDVAVEYGAEVFKNIIVDGKPAKTLPDRGVQTTGEFSTLVLDILNPKWDATFTNQRADTILGRSVWHYDFSIDLPVSSWHLTAIMGQSFMAPTDIYPPYRGAIWIDRETARMMRVERSVPTLPVSFPLQVVRQAIDFDFIKIGDESYLLPSRTESITCTRGNDNCFRNVTVFHDYNKFDAETSIRFEDGGR